MVVKFRTEGFEPSTSKGIYEFLLDKSENDMYINLELHLTDHSIPLGKGNTVRILNILIDKRDAYHTVANLISGRAAASVKFVQNNDDLYQGFKLTKNEEFFK